MHSKVAVACLLGWISFPYLSLRSPSCTSRPFLNPITRVLGLPSQSTTSLDSRIDYLHLFTCYISFLPFQSPIRFQYSPILEYEIQFDTDYIVMANRGQFGASHGGPSRLLVPLEEAGGPPGSRRDVDDPNGLVDSFVELMVQNWETCATRMTARESTSKELHCVKTTTVWTIAISSESGYYRGVS